MVQVREGVLCGATAVMSCGATAVMLMPATGAHLGTHYECLCVVAIS